MPVLTPGKPIEQAGPRLLIENRLKPGRYRFQLVVTDTAGLESAPAELVVTVNEPAPAPTPPIRDPIRPVLRPDIVEPVIRPLNPRIVRPPRRPK